MKKKTKKPAPKPNGVYKRRDLVAQNGEDKKRTYKRRDMRSEH